MELLVEDVVGVARVEGLRAVNFRDHWVFCYGKASCLVCKPLVFRRDWFESGGEVQGDGVIDEEHGENCGDHNGFVFEVWGAH